MLPHYPLNAHLWSNMVIGFLNRANCSLVTKWNTQCIKLCLSGSQTLWMKSGCMVQKINCIFKHICFEEWLYGNRRTSKISQHWKPNGLLSRHSSSQKLATYHAELIWYNSSFSDRDLDNIASYIWNVPQHNNIYTSSQTGGVICWCRTCLNILKSDHHLMQSKLLSKRLSICSWTILLQCNILISILILLYLDHSFVFPNT